MFSYGHPGGDFGYSASFWRFPDQKLTTVVLANTMLPVRKLGFQIADIWSGHRDPVLLPDGLELSAAEINRCAGEFWLEGRALRFNDDNGHLALIAGGVTNRLTALTPTTFVRDGERFEFDTNSPAQRLRASYWAWDASGKRIERAALQDNAARQFVGLYYSSEIGVVYEIEARANRLVVKHARDEADLRPLEGGMFLTDFSTGLRDSFGPETVLIEFDRTEGIAQSFKLSTDRVKHLMFVQMNATAQDNARD